MVVEIYRDTYRKLLEDCSTAIREKKRLQKEALEADQKFRHFLGAAKSIAVILGEQLPDFDEDNDTDPSEPTHDREADGPKGGEPRAIAEALEDVFRKLDTAARVPELIRELIVIDQPLPDDDHRRFGSVYSALKRRGDKFRKIGRGLWVLRGSEADEVDLNAHESDGQAAEVNPSNSDDADE